MELMSYYIFYMQESASSGASSPVPVEPQLQSETDSNLTASSQKQASVSTDTTSSSRNNASQINTNVATDYLPSLIDRKQSVTSDEKTSSVHEMKKSVQQRPSRTQSPLSQTDVPHSKVTSMPLKTSSVMGKSSSSQRISSPLLASVSSPLADTEVEMRHYDFQGDGEADWSEDHIPSDSSQSWKSAAKNTTKYQYSHKYRNYYKVSST
jgi:hypothetical protein